MFRPSNITARPSHSLFKTFGATGGGGVAEVSMLNPVASKEADFNLSTEMFRCIFFNFHLKRFWVSL